jgi:hypothetical protein
MRPASPPDRLAPRHSRIRRDSVRKDVKVLLLLRPDHEARAFEHRRIVERADLDDQTAGRPGRSGREVDAAAATDGVVTSAAGDRLAAAAKAEPARPDRAFDLEPHRSAATAARQRSSGPRRAHPLSGAAATNPSGPRSSGSPTTIPHFCSSRSMRPGQALKPGASLRAAGPGQEPDLYGNGPSHGAERLSWARRSKQRKPAASYARQAARLSSVVVSMTTCVPSSASR